MGAGPTPFSTKRNPILFLVSSGVTHYHQGKKKSSLFSHQQSAPITNHFASPDVAEKTQNNGCPMTAQIAKPVQQGHKWRSHHEACKLQKCSMILASMIRHDVTALRGAAGCRGKTLQWNSPAIVHDLLLCLGYIIAS